MARKSLHGPKIIHPEHPSVQLLGRVDPKELPDLRDYNIPANYGEKTQFYWALGGQKHRTFSRAGRKYWSIIKTGHLHWSLVQMTKLGINIRQTQMDVSTGR